ncbi:MAG: penicillin-binding protein 2 [Alphaproteobacteria bacterium]|jgi:penicillin-binding protein 2|nr:penicillin-binding protein 2 [Alphaproteobacteria bacterium]MDP6517387.1 penicillin-binding protein 2 [Alphaproteobacteria bacterium]
MQQHELRRIKMFNRRAAILGGAKLAMMTMLAGRLYYLQVVQSERFHTLAEENRINLRLLAPPRGRIFDRTGHPVAHNKQNYRLILVPEQGGDIARTLDSLAAIIPLDDRERSRILDDIGRRRRFLPVTIREHLSWSQVSRIEVNAPDLPGVSIDVGQVRQYPFGAAFAHVIGYVAAVSETELTGDPVLELPDFRIGKNGVEKTHDLALRGRAGNLQVEVNAHGRVIRELARNEGQPGDDVTLTIDAGIQEFAATRLGAESASAAVLDVGSGEVLAIASTPSFDPNAFNQGLTHRQWSELVNNPRAPLINKAISGQYPPGSVFKLVVALAALESGIAGPSHRVWCAGHVELGIRRFHCWKRGGHGHLAMTDAIAQSCDVYFYDLALKLGADRIAATAALLGFGRSLEFDLPGERAGLVPTPDWKLATYDRPWQKGETLNVGIGQGHLLTTPLQLAVMTARLVNGGRAIGPYLTRAVGRDPSAAAPEQAPAHSLGVSDWSLRVVREGMAKAVNGPRGTAHGARIEQPAMAMGGKTGTSQVKRITKAERDAGIVKNEDRAWKDRDHALFVGYAPVHQPRYAVAVVVEHGGGGSKVAAPMARDILIEAQRRGSPGGGIPTGALGRNAPEDA